LIANLGNIFIKRLQTLRYILIVCRVFKVSLFQCELLLHLWFIATWIRECSMEVEDCRNIFSS